MLVDNPFLRIESPDVSSERLTSAIASCICPECGAALSLSLSQFRCQGRCGIDWRPLWNRIRAKQPNTPQPVARSMDPGDFGNRLRNA